MRGLFRAAVTLRISAKREDKKSEERGKDVFDDGATLLLLLLLKLLFLSHSRKNERRFQDDVV